ncbi:MAG: serine protein kinase RIO [Candidatus Micrarchaeota archaeon]|nr:serine protein kinase RIO [Candidatus Micrarchaeota archaeon]
MARRVSRRKEPSRDFYTLKEQNKIDSGIFDTKTMVYLSKFYNKGIIGKLDFMIAKGKEANVYVAQPGTSDIVSGSKFIAIKFFRVETTSFFNMQNYIVGDPRFSKIRLTKRNIVKAWCMKEMGNLRIAKSAGIPSPRPYMANGSILAMEFIGNDDGVPAPQLKDAFLDNPGAFLDIVIDQARKLYRAGLVHADLSEYNILVHEGEPHMIDFGQAVILKHPNAQPFLERDVKNMLSYFSKRYSIDMNPEKVLERIKG